MMEVNIFTYIFTYIGVVAVSYLFVFRFMPWVEGES